MRHAPGYVTAGAVLLAGVTAAQPLLTFHRDVLPILQDHCQACHRPRGQNLGGLVAPMPLTTYDEVRPWARAIIRKVEAREMPPWFATDHTRGVFFNERTLTEEQIQTLVEWERSGASDGRREDAPAPKPFLEDSSSLIGWSLGEPDLTVSAEPYWIPDEESDENTSLNTERLLDDIWVQGVEFRASSSVVHHMCAAAILPEDTPGPDRQTSLGCSALGTEPRLLPEGYAFLLPKDTAIRLNIHYHKQPGPGTGVWASAEIGFILSKTPVRHRVRFNPVANTTFEIPPGHASWPVGAARVFERDTTILALWPHGHLRAVAVKYTAVYPDGTKELLLDVPRFDHSWQIVYNYRSPKRIPAGTRIEVVYRYDNSEPRGARRGFDAGQAVRFGDQSTDEMMLGYVEYTDTETSAGRDTPAIGPDATGPDQSAQRDAVDLDRLWRGTAKLKTIPELEVGFPKLGIDEAALLQLDSIPAGTVVSYVRAAAMKLRTEVDLEFHGVSIGTGNVAAGFAGLYGLWIKKTTNGWHLVITNEPDVWGTQYDATTTVAEVPVRYERVSTLTRMLDVSLEGETDRARLVMTWGSHHWVADFAAKR